MDWRIGLCRCTGDLDLAVWRGELRGLGDPDVAGQRDELRRDGDLRGSSSGVGSGEGWRLLDCVGSVDPEGLSRPFAFLLAFLPIGAGPRTVVELSSEAWVRNL